MRKTQGWHHLALLLLLISIFVYSVSSLLLNTWLLFQQRYSALLDAVESAASNYCHWIIAATYIQVSFETRMLLKKETYINATAILVHVDKFRRGLSHANIGIILLILIISVTFFLGTMRASDKVISIANNEILVFQVGCLLAWAWTLIRLYKDIEHS